VLFYTTKEILAKIGSGETQPKVDIFSRKLGQKKRENQVYPEIQAHQGKHFFFLIFFPLEPRSIIPTFSSQKNEKNEKNRSNLCLNI